MCQCPGVRAFSIKEGGREREGEQERGAGRGRRGGGRGAGHVGRRPDEASMKRHVSRTNISPCIQEMEKMMSSVSALWALRYSVNTLASVYTHTHTHTDTHTHTRARARAHGENDNRLALFVSVPVHSR